MTLIKIYPSIKKNHLLSIGRFFYLNVPLDALHMSLLLTPKYYSPSWLAQLTPGGGVRRKPHIDPKVQNGYMLALDKLVPNEECAGVRSEFFSNTSVNMESLVTCIQPKI